jgi:hypothetical protein
MEKDIHTTASSASVSGKEDIMHIEDTKMTKSEKIAAIDAIAEDPSVTLENFAHLDINKILRKIDMRLVPMLTVLVSAESAKEKKTGLMQREEFLMSGSISLVSWTEAISAMRRLKVWLKICISRVQSTIGV